MSERDQRAVDFLALWTERGRGLAERLLASGMSAYALSDLRYRFGVLVRQHGPALAALGAPQGQEGRVTGTWVHHLDGKLLYFTGARAAAENAFNAGWDQVVEGAIRERTRSQRLPGDGDGDDDATGRVPEFLVTLGLGRGASAPDVKRAYRDLAHAAHPDVGGEHELFITLTRARDEALAWIESRTARSERRGEPTGPRAATDTDDEPGDEPGGEPGR